MFPYGVKYTEPKSDIQNINLLYKIDQQHQNTFGPLDFSEKLKTKHVLFYYI